MLLPQIRHRFRLAAEEAAAFASILIYAAAVIVLCCALDDGPEIPSARLSSPALRVAHAPAGAILAGREHGFFSAPRSDVRQPLGDAPSAPRSGVRQPLGDAPSAPRSGLRQPLGDVSSASRRDPIATLLSSLEANKDQP